MLKLKVKFYFFQTFSTGAHFHDRRFSPCNCVRLGELLNFFQLEFTLLFFGVFKDDIKLITHFFSKFFLFDQSPFAATLLC